MKRRLWSVLPALLLAAMAVWAVVAAPPPQSTAMPSLLPEGALLYIQSPDFHALLSGWSHSPEERAWLTSDNYAVFSQSQLFSRLAQAQTEFSAAAGLPADSRLLESIAGKASCIALYNIGNIEFVYLTRMNEAAAESTPLWQSRAKFEQRSEGGAMFYVRQDPQSKRVAAFAVQDGWLILGTREDLVAGVLDRLQKAGGRSLSDEAWYANAIHQAAKQPGDLRMVLNLDKIVPSPYFRSYWVQRNVTEMKQYVSAVLDLYDSGQTWREQRVLLRRPGFAAAPASDVAAISALAPADVTFWSAQASPHVNALISTLSNDLLEPQPEPMSYEADAPSTPVVANAGSASDFETRIDQAPAVEASTDAMQPLRMLLDSAQPSSFMEIDSGGAPRDGVFVPSERAIVVEAAQTWDQSSVNSALTTALLPGLTAGNLGAMWQTRHGASGDYLALDGEVALFAAVRGRDLFLANDEALLASLLAQDAKSASAPPHGSSGVTYAAVFRHSPQAQARFRTLTGLLDRAGNRGSRDNGHPPNQGETPAFFSGNMASLSRVFSSVSQERVEERDQGATVTQTVLYVWNR